MYRRFVFSNLLLILLAIVGFQPAFAQDDLEDQLKVALYNTTGKEYIYYEVDASSEDDNWLMGVVRGQNSLDIPPFVHLFLGKKIGGVVSEIAFQYTPTFDEWLRNNDISFLSDEAKSYLYSPSEEVLNAVRSANVEAMRSSFPLLSFPWRVTKSWRFNGGPHLANPDVDDGILSGIDFGIPYNGEEVVDTAVYPALEGLVVDVDHNCYVWVSHAGGWYTRYLHLRGVPETIEKYKTNVDLDTFLGDIPKSGACYYSRGPHLHFDLGVGLRDFQDIRGFFIGGWYIKNDTTLSMGPFELNQSTARTGPTSRYLRNLGFKGDKWLFGPLFWYGERSPNVPGSAGVCDPRTCYYIQEGSKMQLPLINEIHRVLVSVSDLVVLFVPNNQVVASAMGNASACLDFDVTDLENFNYPGTNIPLIGNTGEIIVQKGDCPQNLQPTRSSTASINPSLPPNAPEGPENYGCGNQSSGIKFTDNSGNCFYMSGSGDATLPFSPTRIDVLDANRRYDMELCNRSGDCDEFNNSGSIDYSSVSRPFVRADVKIQGLTSDSDVANCKTSTGKKVEFATLDVGDEYYTDRGYEIKNITKDELHGLRFLKTPNDDKRNSDPEYIICDVKEEIQIIIAFDGRATRLPEWLKDKYQRIDEEIGVTDEMEHFDLYKCQHKASTKLRLGGPKSNGAEGVYSNYIIIFRKTSGDERNCSSSFNVPPDTPILNDVGSTSFETSPLISWSMSDRNHDEPLEATVRAWKDGVQKPDKVLPIGVTQWMPTWSDPGSYTIQVIVKDDSDESSVSNQITYSVREPDPVVSEPQVSNLQIVDAIMPTEGNQAFSVIVQNVGGAGTITPTLHFYERPGEWHRFVEAKVILTGTAYSTVTFAVDHFYNDFEVVVDPENEFAEGNEEDNSLYKPSLYDFTGFTAGSTFIGNLVVFTQKGQLVFEPNDDPSIGNVVYVSKDYNSNLIFRAPWNYQHIARKDYQTFINELFVTGCITGCESVVLNFINADGEIETQTIDHRITMPQMLVYEGSNSECENPAVYAGVDNPDVWHKLDEGCGWVREAGYPLIVQVPNGHRLDTPDGGFCDGQHVANIMTIWKLQPNEIGCEVYQGWIQTDDEGAEAIAKDFSFNVPDGQVADFWGDTLTLDGKVLKQWTVYRVGPGSYSLTNWTYGTVLIGKDEGVNKNHHQWQATYNAIKFGHGIWTSIDLRGDQSSDVVLVTDPHQTNQIAGSADLRAFVEFNDFMLVELEFPISDTITMRLASDWITEVRLSRNVNETTDLTGRFTVYVPDDRYAEFAEWQPTIFSDVQDWSHEVMQGANENDTVAQLIIRNLQVQPNDLLYIILKKDQPANSTVFSSWMWGETFDPQDKPSQPPVVQPVEHFLFLPLINR